MWEMITVMGINLVIKVIIIIINLQCLLNMIQHGSRQNATLNHNKAQESLNPQPGEYSGNNLGERIVFPNINARLPAAVEE